MDEPAELCLRHIALRQGEEEVAVEDAWRADAKLPFPRLVPAVRIVRPAEDPGCVREELGDDRGVRGEAERGRAAEDERGAVQVLDLKMAQSREYGDRARDERTECVGGEDYPPAADDHTYYPGVKK